MSNTTLYNGEIEVVFNAGSHRYSVNGEFFPGVTGILGIINKPLLMGWASYMAAEDFKESVARLIAEGGQVTDKWLKKTATDAKTAYTRRSDVAKDLGHIVHEGIEAYLRYGSLPIEGTEGYKLIQNFIYWFKASEWEVLGIEQVVYSKQYGYCGTYDIKLKSKKTGKIVIADNKTTKRSYTNQQGIYNEYPPQLGGYAIADEEESGIKVDDLMIINPDKEYGEMQVVLMSDLGITVDMCKESFLKVYDLYNAVKPLEFKLKLQNNLKKGLWYAKVKLGEEE